MRSTPESETSEIADARVSLDHARVALATLKRGSTSEAGPPSPREADALEARELRVVLVERRLADAIEAHERGERRRARWDLWRWVLGERRAPRRTRPEAKVESAGEAGDRDRLAKDERGA